MTRAVELATALASTPELATWVHLACELDREGSASARSVFADLAEAANVLGQPALALACVKWLQVHHVAEADTLLQAIASTHGRGSTVIDLGAKAMPPTPPLAEIISIDIVGDVEPAAASRGALQRVRDNASPVLSPTPLLRVLDAQEIVTLLAGSSTRWVNPGEAVLRMGEPAASLFLIARGNLEVLREGQSIGMLHSGMFFGEIALLAGTSRTADVVCKSECWLLEIPAAIVRATAESAPNLGRLLAEYARSRILATLMRTSALFQAVDEQERAALAQRFTSHWFAKGTPCIREGSHNAFLYVVASGECSVRKQGQEVARLRAGDTAGEISVISGQPAAADVIAETDVVMLRLARSEFDELATRHPQLLARIYQLYIDRREIDSESSLHDAEALLL